MITITHRALSAAECSEIRRQSSAVRTLAPAISLIVLIGIGLSGVTYLVLGAFPGLVASRAIVALLIGGALAAGAWVRLVQSFSHFSKDHRAQLNLDLRAGRTEIWELSIEEALEVEEFGDEGLQFYLRLADGRILFLAGQNLDEFVEERRFPSTKARLTRLPHSGDILALEPLGNHLPPSGKLPHFPPADIYAGRIPMSGALVSADFAQLRSRAV